MSSVPPTTAFSPYEAAFFLSHSRDERRVLSWAVAGSLVIHLIVGIVLSVGRHEWQKGDEPLALFVSFEGPQKIEAPSRPNTRQIVAEPASQMSEPPPQAHRFAERDHRADKEQLARGGANDSSRGASPVVQTARGSTGKRVAPDGPTRAVKAEVVPRKREDAQAKDAAARRNGAKPKLSDEGRASGPVERVRKISPFNSESLRLDPTVVLSKMGTSNTGREASNATRSSMLRHVEKEPSSAEAQSNARLDAALGSAMGGSLGGAGSADAITGIQDGKVTLLNTKADKYAVFVRRVAYRVFNSLREMGWQSLAATHIRAIRQPVIVVAELSPDGAFVNSRIQQPSGSNQFDRLVEAAVRRSVSDPNPPKGAAAADGQIRFLFQSRSTVSIGMSAGPQSMPSERRWLELGTGLD